VNGVVTIEGVSSHTGTARGKMVNALHIAAELISLIPAGCRPETTSGREGFIHPNDIEGNVEKVSIKVIIRDFDAKLLEKRKNAFFKTFEALEASYPGSSIKWTHTGGYRNMKAKLDDDPRIVALALKAIERGLDRLIVTTRFEKSIFPENNLNELITILSQPGKEMIIGRLEVLEAPKTATGQKMKRPSRPQPGSVAAPSSAVIAWSDGPPANRPKGGLMPPATLIALPWSSNLPWEKVTLSALRQATTTAR